MTKLIGPQKKPQEFGLQGNDLHLVVNDQSETCKVFLGNGLQLDTHAALARGQGGDTVWNQRYTDTPPGLWMVTKVYRDWERPGNTSYRDRIAYGWYSFAMKGLEGQEERFGRTGIMLHGGGSALGSAAWEPYQPLVPTLGCIRMHNADLQSLVNRMDTHDSDIFISVYQEAPDAE